MGEATDVVKRVHERFNERDLEGFLALCSKRIVWHEVEDIPGAGVFRGPDEMRVWYEKMVDVSDDLTLAMWETSDERDDAVLAETSAEMTGRGSEMALGWRFWAVWRVQDGVITYHHAYSRREDALAELEGEAS